MLNLYYWTMKYSLDQDPKNVKNVTVCNSIIFLSSDAMYQGVSNENAKKPAVAHVIPKMFSSNDAVNDNPHTVFYCSNDCSILSQSNIV